MAHRIIAGNDFRLIVCAKRSMGAYLTDMDLSEVDSLRIYMTRAGRSKELQSYTLDENGNAVIYVAAQQVTAGIYGIEMVGVYGDASLRAHLTTAFQIVGAGHGDAGVLTDYSVDIVFAINVAASDVFVKASIKAHNEDDTAHDGIKAAVAAVQGDIIDLQTDMPGKVDDVKVDGMSVVETDPQTGKKIVNLHKDQLGKVDDVIVNGDSVLNQNNEAEFTVPTTVEELGDSFNYATKADLLQGLAEKQDTISVVVAPSITEDGGNPAVVSSFNNNQLALAFKNLEGPQGPQGESVLVGQGDMPLVHVPGYDATKAISQKGATEIMDEALNAVKRMRAATPSLVQTGKLLRYDGGMDPSGDTSIVKTYPVDSTKTYYVTCRFTTNTVRAALCFYNSGGNKISALFRGDGSTDAYDIVKQPIYPPEGTATVKVFGSSNYSDPTLYEETGSIDVQGLSDDVEKILSVLPDDMEALAKVTELTETSEESGYSLDASGDKKSSTANARIKVFTGIDDTLNYIVTCRQSKDVDSSGVCLYDNNGDCISAQYTGDGTTSAHDEVKVPVTMVPGTVTIKVFGSAIYEAPKLYEIEGTINLGEMYDDINEMKSYPLRGKNIAIIGDSISTIYHGNTPFYKITSRDVGNQIQSYVSWNDVYTSNDGTSRTPTNKTIGGELLTEAMIDGELHPFTPNANDIGKELYVPRHYGNNAADVKVWSQVLCEKTGANLIANASFSGATVNSSTKLSSSRGIMFEGSHAWHPCTIARCKTRDDNGNIIMPDAIIIARGTNDLTYTNNTDGDTVYPSMSLEFPDMSAGFTFDTDEVSEGEYNFVVAYILTIQRLRAAYPNALIICATPNVFKRVHYTNFPTRNDAWTYPDLCNCIRKIADYMGCGLIEFDKDGINFQNADTRYFFDGATKPTHPNKVGHRVMGEKAAADLKYIFNPA